jgi:hypothetical protein
MRKGICVIPSGARDLLFGTTPSRQITVPTVRREVRRYGHRQAAPQIHKNKRVTNSSGARRKLPPLANSLKSHPCVVCARNPHRITSLRKTPGGRGQSVTNHRCGPICTNSGGAIGFGFNVCFPRQLSNIPTCCTQDTVHFGAQNFST